MQTAKGLPFVQNYHDIRMNTAKSPFNHINDDIYMETARGTAMNTTVKHGPAFQSWEKELLDSTEVKRKATVAQLCKFASSFYGLHMY